MSGHETQRVVVREIGSTRGIVIALHSRDTSQSVGERSAHKLHLNCTTTVQLSVPNGDYIDEDAIRDGDILYASCPTAVTSAGNLAEHEPQVRIEPSVTSNKRMPVREDSRKLNFDRVEPNWTKSLNVTYLGFAPSWHWRLEVPSERWRLRGGKCADCVVIDRMPVGHTIIIGYCADAYISLHHKGISFPHVRCQDASSQPSPEAGTHLHVAAYPPLPINFRLFQHQILDAAASVGLSTPLLAAGYAVTWLHSGVLNKTGNNTIRLRGRVDGEAVLVPRIHRIPPKFLRHFIQAWRLPTETAPAVPNPFYHLHEGASTPAMKAGFHPAAAYQIFRQPDSEMPPPRPQPPQAQQSTPPLPLSLVAFVSRTGSRAFEGEAEVVQALRELFHKRAGQGGRQLRLDVINGTQPWMYYASVVGLIGVHGGAIANVHAMARNATVIEIVGPRPVMGEGITRSYANLALAVDLDYYVYFAKRFPRRLDTFHRPGPGSMVGVDVAHLTAFVDRCFFGTVAPASGNGSTGLGNDLEIY